jgi:threonine/homoserine/homoserine lactone efflux protein
MRFLAFISEAFLISLSGVIAPGPVTAVTIGKGNESPHAGALIAIGHGVIEVPLMISMLYGFGYLLNLSHTKLVIAFVGGLFLLFMGVSMFRRGMQVQATSKMYAHPPIVAGILLSLGNPYFLIWWATVGAALILRSVSFGTVAFIIFALVHWLCDFLWYYFLSVLSFKGGQFFGKRFQKIAFATCGVILLFFSGKFIIDAVRLVFL